MEWEVDVKGDWWYVMDVCSIAKEQNGYVLGPWGTPAYMEEIYPTLEAAKLAAELMFG